MTETPEASAGSELPRRSAPRIYVASLSDYNAGRLHGAWINAARRTPEVEESIAGMLAASPNPSAEEWAIHDYEGFGPLRLSEYEPIEYVSAVARGIAAHGPAFAAWASQLDGLDQAGLERFEDAYRGSWSSTEAYAEELLEDLGATEVLDQVPEWLQPYVKLDVAGFARDLELGGDISVVEDDGSVYVFDKHV